MKMMKSLNAMLLLLIMAVAVGCGKDDPKPLPQENFTTCRIVKSENGNIKYSFVYDNQNRLTKILKTIWSGLFTEVFEYNSLNKVNRQIELNSEDDTISIIKFEYNNDSLLTNLIFRARTHSTDPFYIYSYKSFLYDSNKRLSNVFFHDPNQPGIVNIKYAYTYITDSKVKMQQYDLSSDGITYELTNESEMIFDNKKRPWDHNDRFEIYNFTDHNLLSQTINSIKAGVISSTFSIKYNYTYNSAGYPTESKYYFNGHLDSFKKYEYKCQ
jgi:hypothetical protein